MIRSNFKGYLSDVAVAANVPVNILFTYATGVSRGGGSSEVRLFSCNVLGSSRVENRVIGPTRIDPFS